MKRITIQNERDEATVVSQQYITQMLMILVQLLVQEEINTYLPRASFGSSLNLSIVKHLISADSGS